MLNAMRSGAMSTFVKVIIFGILLLAMAGLALSGGFRFNAVQKTAVAEIDGDELSIMRFDRLLRNVLARQGLDVGTAYKVGFVNQVLAGEINDNLLQRAANDMGLQVGDQAVVRQINTLVSPFVTKDMDRRTALQRILQLQGMSEGEFVRMIKAQMTNTLLTNTIQIGTNVPPVTEASDIYEYQNEQRTVKAIFLPTSGITDVKEPTDEILMPFYQAGQENYAIPETRTFTIAILGPEQIEKTMDISDDDLRSIYNRDIDSYKIPERRVLKQAIVDDQKTAAAIADRVKKGASLKDAVKAETKSDKAYLGEATFEKAGLVDEVAGPVFDAAKGALVGPLQSSLGWHIFRVSDILAPSTRPFEEIKDDLRKEEIQNRAADEMYNAAGAIDDAIAGGATLEEVAKDMNLSIKQYGPIREDGSTADNKEGLKDLDADRDYITQTVFQAGEGEVSPVEELSDGRYAIIRVDVINEKSYKPFEEIRAELAKTWIQDQKDVANKLRAEDAQHDINAGRADLAAIAKKYGADVKTYKLTRTEDAPGPLGNQARDLFFYLKKGDAGTAPANGGFILGQVESITLPDTAKPDHDKLAPVVKSVQQNNQQEFMGMFMANLHNDYKVKINQHLLQTTYGSSEDN